MGHTQKNIFTCDFCGKTKEQGFNSDFPRDWGTVALLVGREKGPKTRMDEYLSCVDCLHGYQWTDENRKKGITSTLLAKIGMSFFDNEEIK